MDNRCVIVLDTENRHPCIESNLGHRVARCTNRNQCIQFVQNQMAIYQQIDLFLSHQHRDLIGNQLVLFNTIYFHIYYPAVVGIQNNHNGIHMWVQKFEEDELWVKISFQLLYHDFRACMQNNFNDAIRNTLFATICILMEEVEAAKLSIETAS